MHSTPTRAPARRRMANRGAIVSALLMVGAMSSTALAAPPESSGIVLRYEIAGGIFVYVDEARDLLAVSGGASAFCGLVEGDLTAEITEVVSPGGAIGLHITEGPGSVAVYPLVEFDELCTDPPAPIAEGTWATTYNDNDVLVSGTRVNAFGGTSRGVVYDADGGAWHLLARDRYLGTPDGEGGCDCEVVFSPIPLKPLDARGRERPRRPPAAGRHPRRWRAVRHVVRPDRTFGLDALTSRRAAASVGSFRVGPVVQRNPAKWEYRRSIGNRWPSPGSRCNAPRSVRDRAQ